MTTEVTSPAGRGARTLDAGSGPPEPRLSGPVGPAGRPRSRRWRWARRVGTAVLALALGSALAVNIARTQAETRASHVSLATAVEQLRGARAGLARAEQRLAAARADDGSVTRAFDAAQAALSSTQATMAKDDAGIYLQGIDLGQLDSCLSGVQQALNQLAVGQKAGGLASLRASSSSCAALDTGGG